MNEKEKLEKLKNELGEPINVFKTLSKINVNEHTEKKNGLTYLSWSWAWEIVKKQFPLSTYSVDMYDNKPYLYDEKLGYMVSTKVNIAGQILGMHLPVMDGANKAMKDKPYQVKTKYKTIDVQQASMFDINKTIMRCLVKNLAMFGLGLYIYSGEDLPEETKQTSTYDGNAVNEDKKKQSYLNRDDLIRQCNSEMQYIKNPTKEIKDFMANIDKYSDIGIQTGLNKLKAIIKG